MSGQSRQVFVGVSGGSDSATALWLLKQEGFQPVGVHLILYSDKGVEAAAKVCDAVGVPLEVLDVRKEFRTKIIEPFASEYLHGQTPNPCALCNKRIKFPLLVEIADNFGGKDSLIATGHYAIVENGRIFRASFSEKDQTYFLALLPKHVVNRLVFPLGTMKKSDARRVLEQHGIPYQSRESQDACFLEGQPPAEYIESLMPNSLPPPGKIVDIEGRPVGIHRGIYRYTVGQRRGLAISANQKLYVVRIDHNTNRIIVGSRADASTKRICASSTNWIAEPPLPGSRVEIKTRYRQKAVPATVIECTDDAIRIETDEPVFAPAPGQILAVYQGSELLGGGIICRDD